MPSSSLTIKSLLTTFTNANEPNVNKSTLTKFALRSGADYCYGFMTFALPAPKGVTYNDGKVRIYNQTDIPANRTITLSVVTSKWSYSQITFLTKPTFTVVGQVAVTHVAASPAGTMWEFDVEALLNAASSGTAWWGFQFSMVDTVARWFHNQKGAPAYIPTLEVNWSEAPDAPATLVPSDGRAVSLAKPVVSCDFHDAAGNASIAGIQVQLNNTAVFTAPAFDSGDVPTVKPELNLATTAYAGAVVGAIVYMRMRVKDGDNNWSEWSNTTTWTRKAQNPLTIDNPADTPNNYVTEATPPIIISMTDLTRFRIVIYNGAKIVADSNILSTDTDTTSWTPPSTAIVSAGAGYRVDAYGYDSEDRVYTPGDPDYVKASKDFTFQPDASVDPVSSLTVSQVDDKPWVLHSFTRDTSPDSFVAIRDDLVTMTAIDPADVFVAGSTYHWIDRQGSARKEHRYSIACVENGVTSSMNPEQSLTIRPSTAWLCSLDGRYAIPLTNYTKDLALGEDSGQFTSEGGDETILISQSLRGFSGGFSGQMSSAVGGKTSAEYLEQFMRLREEEGLPCQLSYADQNLACVIYNCNYDTIPTTEEIMYSATFSVLQKRSVGQVMYS